MKKFLPILLLLSTPVYADLSHSITSSTKLTVGGASTTADRIGSSYSISGTGVDTTHGTGDSAVTNGVGALAISSGIGTPPNVSASQVQILLLELERLCYRQRQPMHRAPAIC